MSHFHTAIFLVLFGIATSAAVADVRIRVANRTGRDLKSVKLVFHDDKVFAIGDLKNGACSPYCSRGATYTYAYAEAYIGPTKVVCQPHDFPGKPDVVRGNYTFVLTYDKRLERPYQLSMMLRKD